MTAQHINLERQERATKARVVLTLVRTRGFGNVETDDEAVQALTEDLADLWGEAFDDDGQQMDPCDAVQCWLDYFGGFSPEESEKFWVEIDSDKNALTIVQEALAS